MATASTRRAHIIDTPTGAGLSCRVARRDRVRRGAFDKRLRPRRRADKARTTVSETAMAGIYLIIAFIAVIAILNRVEFGRFD